MNHTQNQSPNGMTLTASFKYAVSDIRHRLGMVAMPITAIALGTGIFWVVAMYGWAFYLHQVHLVEDQSLTYLSAMSEDIANPETRFTEDKLAEIMSREDVRLAYAKVELGVVLKSGRGSKIQISAEGIHPDDPRVDPEKMVWESPSEKESSSDWMVLDAATFSKLGGVLGKDGPQPSSLILQVTRTRDGREEQWEVPLRISGLLKRRNEDRIHISRTLAARLDLFALNKLDSRDGTDGDTVNAASMERGVAYVNADHVGRLEQDSAYLNIALESMGEVDVLTAGEGSIWAGIAGEDGAGSPPLALREIIARFPGVDVWPEAEKRLNFNGESVRLVVLGKKDPRWRMLQEGPPELGVIVAADPRYRGARLGIKPTIGRVANVAEDWLPVNAELACTPETWAWLTFDPEMLPDVSQYSLMRLDSLPAAVDWAKQGVNVEATQTHAWRLHSVRNGVQAGRKRSPFSEASSNTQGSISDTDADTETLARNAKYDSGKNDSGAGHGYTETSIWTVGKSRWLGNQQSVKVRRIPDSVFRRIGGWKDIEESAEGIPCIWVGAMPEELPPEGFWSSHGNLVVQDHFPEIDRLAEPEIWVPDSMVRSEGIDWKPSGLLIGGGWRAVYETSERFISDGIVGQPHLRHEPDSFWVLRKGAKLEELPDVERSGLSLRKWRLLVARLDGGWRYSLIGTAEEENEPLPPVVQRQLPGGILPMQRDTFYRDVFKRYVTADEQTATGWALQIPDSLQAKRLSEAVEKEGFNFNFLSEVQTRRYLRYVFQERDTNVGGVTEHLISVVGMTKPTFAHAEPRVVETQGRVLGENVGLRGTESATPWRFAAGLRAGTWISDDQGLEVVLPLSVARGEASMIRHLGSRVEAVFTRINPVTHQSESLNLNVKVVGFVEGDEGYLPSKLVHDLNRWRENDRVFNPNTGRFETAAESYSRRGKIRASIVAANSNKVEPLVTWLEASGYRTDSRLGDMEALERTRQSITVIVVLFCMSQCLCAALCVGVTAAMNIRTKSWEIGLLKSLGLSRNEILRIFLIQAGMIGVAGFLAAGLISIGLEGVVIRKVLAALFGGAFNTIIQMIDFRRQLSLGAIALSVAMLFSFLGMLIPALKACRMMPTEALNRRD